MPTILAMEALETSLLPQGYPVRKAWPPYRAASPLQLAHPLAPPTLLFHGGRDELVWLRQSERLAERLTEVGVNHLLVRLQWADHGFDANLWGPASQIYLYVLERFLAAVTQ